MRVQDWPLPLAPGAEMMQRHARAHFKQRAGLGPFALFAKLIAVVGDEHDDGVLAQTEPVQFGDDAADVPVHPRNRGEIGADDLLRLGFARAAADEQVGVALADGRAREIPAARSATRRNPASV